MGKVLKSVAIAAAIIGVALLIPGGVSFLPGFTAGAGTGFTAVTVGATISAGAVGSALIAMAVGTVLAGVQAQFFGPKTTKAQASRLNPTLEPSASRKIVFGETAMNTDVRYFEPSGTDQEYMDYIIATSAHAVESIDEIWFEDRIAWSSATGVDAFYTGYLTVATVLEGTSANYISINGGAKWGSTRRLTGCSYVHIRLKRTGTTSKVDSPLVNGLPSRVTIRGKGAKIYDPRLDSTVTGGSGTQRANDQTTWGVSQSGYRDNPALQLLWFLLGWKIGGKLSVGCGVPPARIDLASFITAANICDEAITLAAGGTQPRYLTAGVASDSDARMEIIQIFLSAMNGTLRDSGGKLAVVCMKNDLASPVLEFADDDIIGDFTWNQTRGLDESFNAIHGKYTDPSDNSLYQAVEYPVQSLTSVDGIERMQTLDLPFVQEGRRAQRIAKQVLERAQYKGIFSATFNMKALGCQVGNCVWIDFEPLGWVNKPFRVLSQGISNSGLVPMTLIEENAAIYAWDASESALVTAVAPTVYDPLNSPYILGTLEAGATANWSGVIDDNGNKPDDNATRNNPAGTHSTASTYSKGDFVSNAEGNYTYIAKIDVPVGIELTNTTYWEVFVYVSGGTSGLNSASIYLYQRATSTPAVPSTTLTYTFATGVLTGTLGSWTQAIPAGTNPIYVTLATAAATTATDTIATTEWATPNILSQNGTNGLNNAMVNLYQRAASTPTAPSGTFTYTFATGVLSGGTPGSWTQTIPTTNGNPLWVIVATASSNTATDTIASTEFSSATKLAEDGASGLNNAVISLYQRASTTPSAPSGTFTYTFSTSVLSGGTPGSWTQAVPAANGNPLWVIAATASSSASTDTIAAAEFSSPVITTGAGNNVASVFIFQRATSTPAVPSASLTYTFSTGLLSGTLGSWTQAIPSGTNPVYVSTATASSTGTTDTITTGEWAAPTILAQDGAVGATGVSTRTVFQRSPTAPATPTASSTTPSGWYDTTTAVPAGSDPMWSTTGERASGGTNYAWGAPIQVQAIVSVSTGQFVNLSFTVSSTMSFSLAAGESRLVVGSMDLRSPTGPGTAYVQIEYRISGGTWTSSNGTVGNYDSSEPLYDDHSITVTNSGTTAQAYEVRGTIIRSNANSGTQNASTSVLRI